MSSHATLSPSAAHRWISCPASVSATAGMDGGTSVFAEEGTAAHEVAAILLKRALGQAISDAEDATVQAAPEAMRTHGENYVDFVLERKGDLDAVLVEVRVATGVRDCYGTADAIIVGPDHLHVVDLKYGQGIQVAASGNEQMMIYALGALHDYGFLAEPKDVAMSIFQPRLGHLDTAIIPAEELMAWGRDVLEPAAEQSRSETAPFGPSESACRWCPLSGRCRAQAEKLTSLDFTPPAQLEPGEVGEAMDRVAEIEQWLKALKRASFDLLQDGEPVTGWKLVSGRATRTVLDHKVGLDRLLGAGFLQRDVSERKLLGVTALDKVTGSKQRTSDILGDALGMSDPKPVVAPVSDPREPLDPLASAVADFAEEQ